MSSKATLKRSNSSLYVRNQLKTSHVHIPDVDSRVDLNRYIEVATRIYGIAYAEYNRQNYNGAYIEFQKFLVFTLEKLPSHSVYQQVVSKQLKDSVLSSKINELRALQQDAAGKLEEVVIQMDIEQDQIKEREVDIQLIEAFECEDDSDSKSSKEISQQKSSAKLIPPSIEIKSVSSTEEKSPTANTPVKKKWDIFHLPHFSNPFSSTPKQSHKTHEQNDDIVSISSDSKSTRDLAVNNSHEDRRTLLRPALSVRFVEEHKRAFQQNKGYTIPPNALTNNDYGILKNCSAYRSFQPMSPTITTFDVTLQAQQGLGMQCYKDDFHTSFGGFLHSLQLDSLLQMSREATEPNRCFFIHLGIAIGVHPFALQAAFRVFAVEAMNDPDCWYGDILRSVTDYGAFVDANALSVLWPEELEEYRICIISYSKDQRPIFSCFCSQQALQKGVKLREVLILCKHEHFTLLRPLRPRMGEKGFEVISDLLAAARSLGFLVQENEVQSLPGRSVDSVINAIWSK